MAKERTSVRMQAQIKIMLEQGHSIRSIARVLKLSRRTVRKYLESVPQPPSESGGWEEQIDWDSVRQEVYGKGTTVKQIGQEVAPEIPYVKFWRVFREQAGRQASPEQVTIRLNHKPAEKTQVDFCDGVGITERVSGKKILTQFFLGVLPFSSYAFGEFVLDQKLESDSWLPLGDVAFNTLRELYESKERDPACLWVFPGRSYQTKGEKIYSRRRMFERIKKRSALKRYMQKNPSVALKDALQAVRNEKYKDGIH